MTTCQFSDSNLGAVVATRTEVETAQAGVESAAVIFADLPGSHRAAVGVVCCLC